MKNRLWIMTWPAVFLSLIFAPVPGEAAKAARLRDAVVKIEILYAGIPVSFGTGFFISEDGHLVTNEHVVNKGFDTGYQAVFHTFDGRKIETAKLAGCSDERNIDLCLLQLPIRPKAWFTPSKGGSPRPEPGDKVLAIGHPKGYDFTVTDGIVSAWRTRRIKTLGEVKGAIDEVQISAPISPGNSGGPIFDELGRLVGMATWVHMERDAQNLNFGIAADEIWAYAARHQKLHTASDVRKKRQAQSQALDEKLFQLIFAPSLAGLEKGEAPDRRQFEPLRLPFAGRTYEIPVPRFIASSCEVLWQSQEGFRVRCPDRQMGIWTFFFGVEKAPQEGFVRSFKGKTVDRQPLPIVQELKAAGKWEAYKKKVPPDVMKFLFSMPQPAECKSYGPEAKVELLRDSDLCRVFVYNDAAPDAASLTVLIKKRGSPDFLRVVAWTANSDFAKTTDGIASFPYLAAKAVSGPAAAGAGAQARLPAQAHILPSEKVEEATVDGLAKRRATVSEDDWLDLDGKRLRVTGVVRKLRARDGPGGSRHASYYLSRQGLDEVISVTQSGGPGLAEGQELSVEGPFNPGGKRDGNYSRILGWISVRKEESGKVRVLAEAAASEQVTVTALAQKRASSAGEDWVRLEGTRLRVRGVIDQIRKLGTESSGRFVTFELRDPAGEHYVSIKQQGRPMLVEGKDMTFDGTFSPAKGLGGKQTRLLGWLELEKGR